MKILIFLFVIAAQSISAQQSSAAGAQTVGISLEAEIQNIERTIAGGGISAAQRHQALVRLANLRQLSGDIEGAARNWLEAAAALPGRIDDDALLACAYCLAAMGEWERAATALEPLLSKSAQARFLDFSIEAIRTGDTSSLAAIANNADYSEMKAQIMFILWKVSRGNSGERWRQRLINEYPQSPEGRLAANFAAGASSIIVKPSPFWLFAAMLDGNPLPAQTGSFSVGLDSIPQAGNREQVSSTGRLQTGIFTSQANAQAQAASLSRAGFSASIEQRDERWAVVVPVDADQSQTTARLRSAGFDAFLVR